MTCMTTGFGGAVASWVTASADFARMIEPNSLFLTSSRLTMVSMTTRRGMIVEASASRKLRRMLVLMCCRSSTCSPIAWPIAVCGSGSGQKTANFTRAAGSSMTIVSPSPIVQILRSSGTPSPSLSMRMNHSPYQISGSPSAAERALASIMPRPPGCR